MNNCVTLENRERRDEMKDNKENESNSFFYDFFKRAFDIVVSLVATIVLSPVILILAIAVKVDDPQGKVFFAHKRVGKNGREIKILKFRSMVHNAEELIEQFTPEQKEEYYKNFKLDNDPRITKLGNFLRKTSLDELPQLLNIFFGDISLVGPRPVLERETQLYGKDRSLLLSVKPGLTGYWAVNGRSTTDYDERIQLELYYVRNRSFWLDIKIIFKTFTAVFKGEGAQ